MNKDFLRFPDQKATHRLVLLHGWGADAEDLIPLGQDLIRSVNKKVELVALNAPDFHPDGNGKQWYGLFPADWDAVPKAIYLLQKRLKALETEEIQLQKTIVLGFSQGGAMALSSCCDLPIAGIIACSAYPHPGWKYSLARPEVFLTHGIEDEIVPIAASDQLMKELYSDNHPIELFKFHGGHEISLQAKNKIIYILSNLIN